MVSGILCAYPSLTSSLTVHKLLVCFSEYFMLNGDLSPEPTFYVVFGMVGSA